MAKLFIGDCGKMNKICGAAYGSDDLPVFAEADVVVCGGGPGGLGAALMSVASGASTLVLEAYGLPGGMAAISEVHPFMVSVKDGLPLDAPVYNQWREAMNAYLPDNMMKNLANEHDYSLRSINKEAAALAAEDLLLAAGVKILYHHTVAGVRKKDQTVTEIICHTKGGFGVVRGKCFVDCTGNGDVAAMADCPFEYGNAEGDCQPMTLCFKLSHVDIPYVTNAQTGARLIDSAWKAKLNQAFNVAKQAGVIDCPRENVLVFPFQLADENVLHFNTTRICGYDATNGASFSAAGIEGRRQMRELIAWLRKELPEFRNARLMSVAVQTGVRESRRIMGHYKLNYADFISHARFDDAIARCSYHIDIHSPNGSGTRLQSLAPNEFYEIPYRSVVPLNCDNLTVGGRPISADVDVHSSLRIMPTAVSIGQGAGLGAALAALRGTAPIEVSGEEIREILISRGAHLEK